MSNSIIPENFIGNAKKLDDNEKIKLQSLADFHKIELALVKAVIEIESSGNGFLSNNKPIILFESHIFGNLTQHKYSTITDSAGRPISTRNWNRSTYGATGDWQYHRLSIALNLDEDAALKSCSWGLFQIMGFNYELCKYSNIKEMVSNICESEYNQVEAAFNFMVSTGSLEKLKIKDFAGFARIYNGAGYAENQYDIKLQRAYQKHSANTHIEPVEKNKTLIVGDSLAYGVGAFIQNSDNKAVVGSGYNHWKSAINNLNYEGYNNVFISLGLNDFPSNETEYKDNIRFILNTIISRDKTNSINNIIYLKPTTKSIRRDLIEPSKLIGKILSSLSEEFKKLIIIEVEYPVLNKMLAGDKLHYSSEGYRNIAFLVSSYIDNKFPMIKKGYSGIDVKFLQSVLYELDKEKYNVGVKDGIFGNKTDSIIKLYQKDDNLIIDGIVGNGTWGSLLFKYNKLYEDKVKNG